MGALLIRRGEGREGRGGKRREEEGEGRRGKGRGGERKGHEPPPTIWRKFTPMRANKMGQRTKPCGTAYRAGDGIELVAGTQTYSAAL